METWSIESVSAEMTRALGERLGRLLAAGDVVTLSGDLGAGKTTMAAGIGLGLEVPEPLRSPTYLLCEEYLGREPVVHLDAYFRERLDSLLGEGLAERLAEGAVVLLEWPERVLEWLPASRLEVRLTGMGERRSLEFRALGAEPAARLAALRAAWVESESGEAQNL